MIRPEERGRTVHADAFGVALTFHDDDVELAGLSLPSPARDAAPTSVRHDPLGLRKRWSSTRPTRAREVREGEDLLLSVDHDPACGYLICAPGVGKAFISPDGLEVLCAPEMHNEIWQALLVGQVLPSVATIRGLEVFHAAGVVIGERSYVLCAASGVGKTSLAAHLVMHGAELLSDDAVAVDDGLIGHPGATVLHVRELELRRLGGGPLPGLRRLGMVTDRATFAPDRPAAARPLGGVYLLERTTGAPEIESVPDPSPFALLGATFNLSVRTSARLVHQLDLCARMAALVPTFRVHIAPDCSAADLASALSAHIHEHGAARV